MSCWVSSWPPALSTANHGSRHGSYAYLSFIQLYLLLFSLFYVHIYVFNHIFSYEFSVYPMGVYASASLPMMQQFAFPTRRLYITNFTVFSLGPCVPAHCCTYAAVYCNFAISS